VAVCTSADVFQFCGSPSDVQTTQATAVTALIANVTAEVEAYIGRKLESTAISNVIMQNGLNCEIYNEKLYLCGIYRDLYSISLLKEDGVTLTAVAAYNDGGSYYLDKVTGSIIRNGQNWSLEPFSILLSGNVGIGGATVSNAIKQLIIEIVSSKAGLLKTEILTDQGTIDTVKTLSDVQIKKMLKSYINRSV
jgi:hypothetical protein